ncbi:MAG: hypothetical protein ABF479_00390 [Gluconacetobacter sp.]
MTATKTTAQTSKRDLQKARDAANAISDISMLGGMIALMESNNLRTPWAREAGERIKSICERAQRAILANHDDDMRGIGI